MMTSAQVVETSINVTNTEQSLSGLLSPGRSKHTNKQECIGNRKLEVYVSTKVLLWESNLG